MNRKCECVPVFITNKRLALYADFKWLSKSLRGKIFRIVFAYMTCIDSSWKMFYIKDFCVLCIAPWSVVEIYWTGDGESKDL